MLSLSNGDFSSWRQVVVISVVIGIHLRRATAIVMG